MDVAEKAYAASKPFVTVSERADNGQNLEVKLKMVASIPDELIELAAYAVDDLRSSLDQTCYAVCEVRNPNPKKSHFPFASDADGVALQLRKGNARDIPAEVAPLIAGFNPHKKGDVELWALNALRNCNQHRFLTPMNVTAGNMFAREIAGYNADISFSPRFNRKKKEILFATLRPGATLRASIDVGWSIGFGDVPAIATIPAVHYLRRMAARVESIIDAIEAESLRVGLFPPPGDRGS